MALLIVYDCIAHMQKKLKKKLSILHLTNNYRPYSSGVANSIDQLNNQLLSMEHQSHIVTLDFLGKKVDEQNVTRLFSPIRFTYKKNPMAIPLVPSRQIKKIVAEKKPDIIHVHHPFLLGAIGLEVAQKNKIPIVFTYHTQYEKYVHYIPLPASFTQSIVLKLVHDFCNKVDGIIAPSNTIKDDLHKAKITKEQRVIPSAISERFFSENVEKKCKKPVQLLTVSRFVKEKNIEFLLRVMKKLTIESTLTLVGYGAHEKFLRFYAFQKLGLASHQVQFCIKPSKEELLNYYQEADVFIFASTTETQGMVLAEAMACGTPVVAVSAAGSNDIVKHAQNGFLVADEDQMVAAILHVSQNPGLYHTLSGNAWQTAQAYRSEVLSQNVIDFYYAVIDKQAIQPT